MIAVRHPVVAVDDLPWLIATEYDQQPGLRLTFPQVQRLWGLSTRECYDVLAYLIETGMLVYGEDHQYRRRDLSVEVGETRACWSRSRNRSPASDVWC